MKWHRRQGKLEGHYDGFLGGRLRGWVFDRADLEKVIHVEVYADDSFCGSYPANLYREDLRQQKKGIKGKCAFEIEFDPAPLLESGKSELKVELAIANTGGLLLGKQHLPDGEPIRFVISRRSPTILRKMHSALAGRTQKETARSISVLAAEPTVRLAKEVRIFQFHSGSAVGDAVTNSMFYIQDMLRDFQIESDIFVEHRDDRLASRIRLIDEFAPREDDLLIIHHSMGHDIIGKLQNLSCRKVLLYHNITPPSFFPSHSPFRHYATLGLLNLSDLRSMVRASIADSEFNARELEMRGYRNVCVIPCLKDFSQLRHADFNPTLHYFGEPRYDVIFVGRICPNKGQLELVHFMNEHAGDFDLPIHLTLIGRFDHAEEYADQLRQAVEASAFKDQIHIVGHVSDRDLYGYYRTADAYVSYSAHEGFGVPLLEAMALDVPVVAFEGTAVGETLGAAGIKLRTRNPAELAAALRQLFVDRDYWRMIIRGQRRRLQDFDRDVVAARLAEFLSPHLPKGVKLSPRGKEMHRGAEAARRYLIEGPCETSYSLAIVNRGLGVALDATPKTRAHLIPAEGVEGYVLREEGVRQHPEIEPLLQTPNALAQETIISIRNMFPLRPAGMLGDFRLAYFFWEESEVPRQMVRLINRYLDGIIAPTKFGLRSYRNSGIRVPMAVCGAGLDPDVLHCVSGMTSHGVRRPFTFVHVSSGMPRKGIEELMFAYAAAFRPHEDVQLIIKTHSHQNNVVQAYHEALLANRSWMPSIKIMFEELSDEQMKELYGVADAIVLPTRGEGFNLPAAEGLALGIPVIVTGYSGHMDFLNEDNAILLDYDFELSRSHLAGGEAMWVRANVADLAGKMRALFDGRMQKENARKVANGRETALKMLWSTAASKVNDFVDALETGHKQMTKLKVAWISTWNTRCGIASYSESLIKNLPEEALEIAIFANHLKDEGTIDSSNVVRCWTDRNGSLEDLVQKVINGGYQVAVFQYNFGFHSVLQLGAIVRELEAVGVDTYVFFHKTADTTIDGNLESIGNVKDDLEHATRLIVHSVEDVNRLKKFGLVENVVKIPQGTRAPPPLERDAVREFVELTEYSPIIACFGFLLPGKGVPELILAFGMLLNQRPNALLLLLNSTYPSPVSEAERRKCLAIIDAMGLQNKVLMVNDYLDIDESLLLLSAADCVAFPYQDTKESSSAAVRQGIASLRPVLATPLPIFDDVANVVHFLPGLSPADIMKGILRVIDDADAQKRIGEQQVEWLREHSWSQIGERFANMLMGIYHDRHGVSIHVPPPAPVITSTVEDVSLRLLEELRLEEFLRVAVFRATGKSASGSDVRSYLDALRENTMTKAEAVYAICNEMKAGSGTDIGRTDPWKVSFSELVDASAEEFVRKLYLMLLLRTPVSAELTDIVERLSSHSLTRHQAVEQILTSEEFLVNDLPIKVVMDQSWPTNLNFAECDTDTSSAMTAK